MLRPDASLIRLDRWQALTAAECRSFALLCPILVVEIASPSDEGPRSMPALRRNMAANQASGTPRRLVQLQVLEATPEFPGLQLQQVHI